MSFEDLRITKSCESYILRRVPFLASAFPGYLVFGETNCGQSYINDKCLRLNFFDYSKLSECVLKCVQFIAEENKDTELIHIIDNQEMTYFCQGFLKTVESVSEKNIKFIISSGLKRNELIFSVIEFNNLIYVLKRCLISSLCLKDEEELFVTELIKNRAEFIMSCKKTYSVALDFVQNYLKSQCVAETKKASFIELIRYHNESFLVLKKLHLIFCDDDS